MLTLIVALLATQQTATPAPAPAAPPAVRRPAATSANVQIHVIDRTGAPAEGVRIAAEGPTSREALSDAGGVVMLRTLPLGTYRLRAEGDGFITLEKEVIVRAGAAPPIEVALSRAPAPPKVVEPPPAPAPAPAVVEPPAVRPGDPRVLSLLDVAEDSLGGKEPVRSVPIGCSGLSQAQLLVVRESLPAESRPDADDMLYVIAGEASITIAGKTQTITSGYFSIVPRGTLRTITRRGRNPAILLSIVGGPPCATPASQ